MKITFYCEVPEYAEDPQEVTLFASTTPGTERKGYTRVRFSVDMPASVLKMPIEAEAVEVTA